MDTETDLEFSTFIRKPFIVEAVEVTEENIGEISKFVGTLREKEDGSPYISVNRMLFPNIYRVYPGFWMTKMGDNVRCYSRQVFTRQFVSNSPDLEIMYKSLNTHAFMDNDDEDEKYDDRPE